jgi:hypothetical protein
MRASRCLGLGLGLGPSLGFVGFARGLCLASLLLLQLQLLVWQAPSVAAAPRVEVNGPVVTLTLKEPSSTSSGGSSSKTHDAFAVVEGGAGARPWITDLASIRPKASWSIRTSPTPFPDLLPALKQLRADVIYEYHRLRTSPSAIEATARLSTAQADLVIQPVWDLVSRKTSVLLQASRGANYVLAKLGGGPSGNARRSGLSALKGSFLVNLPYATVGAVRLTPAWDGLRHDVALTLEAITGGPSRTKAVLHLDAYNPTLTVVHALDDRNVIAPEINLANAKIVYQWDLKLGPHGSSLRTKVDPVTAIHLTWTDVSASGGSWVTDVRLPLEGSTVAALAADVRIRRQFRF